MELTRNFHRAKDRALIWLAVTLFAILILMFARTALPAAGSHGGTVVKMPPAAVGNGLIDRGAERILQSSPTREGGPGGQFGDTP